MLHFKRIPKSWVFESEQGKSRIFSILQLKAGSLFCFHRQDLKNFCSACNCCKKYHKIICCIQPSVIERGRSEITLRTLYLFLTTHPPMVTFWEQFYLKPTIVKILMVTLLPITHPLQLLNEISERPQSTTQVQIEYMHDRISLKLQLKDLQCTKNLKLGKYFSKND